MNVSTNKYFGVLILLVVLLLGGGHGNAVMCVGIAGYLHTGSRNDGACHHLNSSQASAPSIAALRGGNGRGSCGPCLDIPCAKDLLQQRLRQPTTTSLPAPALPATQRLLPPSLLNARLLASQSGCTTLAQRTLRSTVLRC